MSASYPAGRFGRPQYPVNSKRVNRVLFAQISSTRRHLVTLGSSAVENTQPGVAHSGARQRPHRVSRFHDQTHVVVDPERLEPASPPRTLLRKPAPPGRFQAGFLPPGRATRAPPYANDGGPPLPGSRGGHQRIPVVHRPPSFVVAVIAQTAIRPQPSGSAHPTTRGTYYLMPFPTAQAPSRMAGGAPRWRRCACARQVPCQPRAAIGSPSRRNFVSRAHPP